MVNTNPTITLIGTRLAKIGVEFIFYGPTNECEACRLKNTCNNLEIGNKYRIVGIKNGQVHKCAVHDTGVYAVEVLPAPTTAIIESKKAFNGSKIVYESPDCKKTTCDEYNRCHPGGLKTGDKYTIISLIKDDPVDCSQGYSLKTVRLM